jgi:hypothetical protein
MARREMMADPLAHENRGATRIVRGEEQAAQVREPRIPMARHEGKTELVVHENSEATHIVRGEEKVPQVHEPKTSMARHEARGEPLVHKASETTHIVRAEEKTPLALQKPAVSMARHEARAKQDDVALVVHKHMARHETAAIEVSADGAVQPAPRASITRKEHPTQTHPNSQNRLVRGETVTAKEVQKPTGRLTRKPLQAEK